MIISDDYTARNGFRICLPYTPMLCVSERPHDIRLFSSISGCRTEKVIKEASEVYYRSFINPSRAVERRGRFSDTMSGTIDTLYLACRPSMCLSRLSKGGGHRGAAGGSVPAVPAKFGLAFISARPSEAVVAVVQFEVAKRMGRSIEQIVNNIIQSVGLLSLKTVYS